MEKKIGVNEQDLLYPIKGKSKQEMLVRTLNPLVNLSNSVSLSTIENEHMRLIRSFKERKLFVLTGSKEQPSH